MNSPITMEDLPTWIAVILVLAALLLAAKSRSFRSTPGLPLPPGPPGYPLIGNLFDVPSENIPPSLRDINLKYGDVVYLNVCGQPMIILGSHKAAVDLLDKRSSNYSDRRDSHMASLTGWNWLFAVNGYGQQWRKTRRLFHEYINPSTVARFQPIQEREACKYLLRVLDDPKRFLDHARHLFGAIIFRTGYGIDVDEVKDIDHLAIAEAAVSTFSVVFLPGKYLVEMFPILRFLPSFMPGAAFKRQAAEWAPYIRKMREVPWEAAKTAYREGSTLFSMASGMQERLSQLDEKVVPEEEEWSKNAIASAYAGGLDTTLSTSQTFYIVMASFPEYQKRAQAELDRVVGPHRLPTFADRKNLPYVVAVIKECLRWRPVGPLSIPHYSGEEDEYNGYRIPAHSVVISNLWANARDPQVYKNPEVFDPERFLVNGELDPNVFDPINIVFGYGRRVCPGRLYAEASIYAAISMVLHTMSIEAPLDEYGQPVCLANHVKMTDGLISYPEPFECTIKPRSPEAEMLIRAYCNERIAANVNI